MNEKRFTTEILSKKADVTTFISGKGDFKPRNISRDGGIVHNDKGWVDQEDISTLNVNVWNKPQDPTITSHLTHGPECVGQHEQTRKRKNRHRY